MIENLRWLWFFYVASVWGKLVGLICHIPIPKFLRPFIITAYGNYSKSRMYESTQKMDEFENIHQFFVREIKARPIDRLSPLVAPVDSTVACYTKLSDANGWRVEQVKGITYKLEEVLGLSPRESAELKTRSLYSMTIHLPASECHRFRSPADWKVKNRLHIPGVMYELNSKNVWRKPVGILHNERVVLEGEWQHGKFFFVPIGSAKVGSIRLYFDQQLKTNYIGETFRKEERDETMKTVHYTDRSMEAREKHLGGGVELKKGEEFGCFEGGSAFVIVFEYPADRQPQWCTSPPQFVLYGNRLIE